MQYALVTSNGNIIRREWFNGAPFSPGLTKWMRWLPDNPPVVEPWQIAQVSVPISPDASEIPYSIVDRPLEEMKAEKLAALADLRWQKETGGFVWNGINIATDDRSQLKITGARLAALADEEYSVRWKIGPGDFVELDAATLIALSDAVRTHVQACFDREAEHSEAILALETARQVYEYDITSGW